MDIREILGNATMAHTNMDIKIDAKLIVKSLFDLLEESKENIKMANEIDVKNNNGFEFDIEMFEILKAKIIEIEDSYRKVIYLRKNTNNYLEGKQTDKLGTICVAYNGNTYCFLELICKAILTHNAVIFVSEADYMKGTNELILILVRRILEAYGIDKNLVQIMYTTRLEELLSNSVSINKVIAIGNKDFKQKIQNLSKVEVISKGYNVYDVYIEDDTNISFIEKIVEAEENINIYVKRGIEVPFEEYIEVEDVEEAISMINFNSSGYSSSIFTDNAQNGSKFLNEIKTDYISVNSSPLVKNILDLDINLLLRVKNMIYPSPLAESTEKNKIEFPTTRL